MDTEVKLGVGEIISGTMGAIAERPVPYLALVGGMALLGTLADQIGAGVSNMGVNIASSVASFALLTHLFTLDGLPPQRSFGAGFISYIGASIVSGIGMVLGFILLVLPGFYLLARWSLSTGLIISEDAHAIDSLKRSWNLTRASQWSIFLAVLVLGVAMLLVLALLGGGVYAMEALAEGVDAETPSIVEAMAINTAAQAVGAVGVAGSYFLTRRLAHADAGLDRVFE